jgi:hypothetical protein
MTRLSLDFSKLSEYSKITFRGIHPESQRQPATLSSSLNRISFLFCTLFVPFHLRQEVEEWICKNHPDLVEE